MKKGFTVSLLALLCAGCAYFYHPSEQAYDRSTSNWIGLGSAELYAEWGYPQKSEAISENAVLETYYVLNKEPFVRSIKQDYTYYRPFSYKWETKVHPFSLQQMPEEYNCRTSFIIVNGVIVDYSYKGFGCVE